MAEIVRKHSHFLAAWLRSPLSVGALFPSSPALARAMADQVDIARPGKIVELGAGTGPITQALLDRRIPASRLIVTERDADLFAILKQRFPQLDLRCADASALLGDMKEVATIVSGLPLRSLPKSEKKQVEHAMAAAIRNGGAIIQFTYGLVSPIARKDWKNLKLRGRRQQLVLANLPPAHIWVYRAAGSNN